MLHRDFELDEIPLMLNMIKLLTIDHRVQYSVIPLPESVSDTSHTGWRLCWPETRK